MPDFRIFEVPGYFTPYQRDWALAMGPPVGEFTEEQAQEWRDAGITAEQAELCQSMGVWHPDSLDSPEVWGEGVTPQDFKDIFGDDWVL